MPRDSINAGIWNHFVHWLSRKSNVDSPAAIDQMTTDMLIQSMLRVPSLSEEYIDECDSHYKVGNNYDDVIDYAMRMWP